MAAPLHPALLITLIVERGYAKCSIIVNIVSIFTAYRIITPFVMLSTTRLCALLFVIRIASFDGPARVLGPVPAWPAMGAAS